MSTSGSEVGHRRRPVRRDGGAARVQRRGRAGDELPACSPTAPPGPGRTSRWWRASRPRAGSRRTRGTPAAGTATPARAATGSTSARSASTPTSTASTSRPGTSSAPPRRGATSLQVFRPDGRAMVSSTGTDLTAELPEGLAAAGRGQANLAYVAEGTGAYTVEVDGAPGPYTVHVEAYRPGTEGRGATRKQTILLDLDGAIVDTSPFGGQGDRRLSPMRDFLTAWGLPARRRRSCVRRIMADVQENLDRDLARRGSNDRLAVTVTSTSSGANRWGQQGRVARRDRRYVRRGGDRDDRHRLEHRPRQLQPHRHGPRAARHPQPAPTPPTRARSTTTSRRAATGSTSSPGPSPTSPPTRWGTTSAASTPTARTRRTP